MDSRQILPETSSLPPDRDPLPWPSSLAVWEKIIKHRRWEATQCSPAPLILPLPALRKPHRQLPYIRASCFSWHPSGPIFWLHKHAPAYMYTYTHKQIVKIQPAGPEEKKHSPWPVWLWMAEGGVLKWRKQLEADGLQPLSWNMQTWGGTSTWQKRENSQTKVAFRENVNSDTLSVTLRTEMHRFPKCKWHFGDTAEW